MQLSKEQLNEAINSFIEDYAEKKGNVDSIDISGLKQKKEVCIVYCFSDGSTLKQVFEYNKFINLVSKHWRRKLKKQESWTKKLKDYFRYGDYKSSLISILEFFVFVMCGLTFMLLMMLLIYRADVKCRLANPYSYDDYRFCMGI